MAYAAVTSLMETLSLHFLPLEDLEAQMRDNGNENQGWTGRIKACLHGIIFNQAVKQTTDYLKKKLISSEMQLAESSSQNVWHSIPLTSSQFRDVAEVNQKMISLHENLSLLQDILTQNSEIIAKDLEAEIRDAAFEVEKRIEMELSSIYLWEGQADSLLHITDCLHRLHEIFNEAEKQTDYLKNELMIRIQSDEHQLPIPKASSQNETVSPIAWMPQIIAWMSQIIAWVICIINVSRFFKKSSKFDDSSGMVGCQEVFKKILNQLTQQSTKRSRKVVSIVGMGGIGKTTLAHKLYEYPSITSHFDKRAWVTISQGYSVEQMLRCLIDCVAEASRDELHEQSTAQDQLAETLHKCLKCRRYLIVIDDIWSTSTWDSVERCFPDDNNGSCILLTSQHKKVVKHPSPGNYVINMPLPFLNVDESWSLYCKVFGKIEFPPKFEQIGRNIVKKCRGLPLAITVVASLLSKTEEVEEKWKNVAKSITGNSNDACSRILYLSYNQLPPHLKACFLYFGIFEDGYEISVKKLVRLWAAEGFLSSVKHVNMEEVGMECLQDLVDRSLVIVSKQSYNGKIKRVRIHDLLRDLCLKEASYENLLNVIGDEKPCRWICLTSRTKVRFEDDECFHKSHSFHCTHLYNYRNADVEHLFSHLKLLRVVDMRGIFFDEGTTPNVLANLVHLRYLAFFTDNTFEIKLFKHWNMQSFIVSGAGVTLDSSEANRIWKMPRLRNFCIGQIVSIETPSVGYRNLENISWLDSKLCTKNLFTRIPNLKKLGIHGGRYKKNNLYFLNNLVHLGQLEKLSVRRWKWKEPNLAQCKIQWATSCLPNLKKLNLLKSNLPWSELSPISMLPNLEVLKLINSCRGPQWDTNDGGFRRLKRLVIKKTNLKYWNAVDDHFPMLECLEISNMKRLEEIPRGFADITTLALIQLSYCRDSLVTSAKWIKKEQYDNYGNDALLVRSENILT